MSKIQEFAEVKLDELRAQVKESYLDELPEHTREEFEDLLKLAENIDKLRRYDRKYRKVANWSKEIALISDPIYRDEATLIYEYNQNVAVIYTGKPGSGKSFAAVGDSYYMDYTFYDDMEKRLSYRPVQFMNVLTEKNARGDYYLKKGMSLLIEEAQQFAHKRLFYSFVNIGLSIVFAAFRYRNLRVAVTVPTIDFIDKDIRKMMRYQWFFRRVVKKRFYLKKGLVIWRKFSEASGYMLDITSMKTDLMQKRISVRKTKIDRWYFYKPPPKVYNKYLLIEKPMKDNILESVKKEMIALEKRAQFETNEGQVDHEKLAKIILDRRQKYGAYVRAGLLRFDPDLIASDFKLKASDAIKVKKLAERMLKEEVETYGKN